MTPPAPTPPVRADAPPRDHERDLFVRGFVVLAALYILWFYVRQSGRFFDPYSMEWDARGMLLTVLRYHGSGVLQNDLNAERATAMATVGWRALFWVGTLVASPVLLTRIFAFALVGFAVWQAFQFGRRHAGPVAGATSALLVCYVPFFWDRIVGANPRGFGMPLLIAFLRYATERNRRAVYVVLVCTAAFYPSVLLVCALTCGLVTLEECVRERTIRPLLPLFACGVVCGAFIAPLVLHPHPLVGSGITLAELEPLIQRAYGALYPLRSISDDLRHSWNLLRDHTGRAPLVADALVPWLKSLLAAVQLGLLAAALITRRRELLRVFGFMFLSTLIVYFIARAVAHRLYIPDRMLQYSWTPMIVLLLPVGAVRLAPERWGARGTLVLPTVLLVLFALATGVVPARTYALHDWNHKHTKTIDFIATLPPESLVIADVDTSTYISLFAKRNSLAASVANSPNFGALAREMERRIGGYYTAYYARSLDDLKQFAAREGGTHLVVDARDFGPDAAKRAHGALVWRAFVDRTFLKTPPQQMALAHPPEGAIVFKDGPIVVLDLKKL